MPLQNFTIEWVAPMADAVAHDYHEVARRFTDTETGFRRVMGQIEETEQRFFDRLRGRYVLTGATRASLTQPTANGAIRASHRDGLRFGTTVPWAHFLTKSPHDPEAGQIRKGDSGKGRSAVVVFPRSLQRKVAKTLLDFILEPAE